jgi:hypothetical protein
MFDHTPEPPENCGDGISAGKDTSCELARSRYLAQAAAGGYSEVTLMSVIDHMRGVSRPSCFCCNTSLEDRAFEAKVAA